MSYKRVNKTKTPTKKKSTTQQNIAKKKSLSRNAFFSAGEELEQMARKQSNLHFEYKDLGRIGSSFHLLMDVSGFRKILFTITSAGFFNIKEVVIGDKPEKEYLIKPKIVHTKKEIISEIDWFITDFQESKALAHFEEGLNYETEW